VTEAARLVTLRSIDDSVLGRHGPLVVTAGLGSHGFAHAPQVGETLAAMAHGPHGP